MTLTITLDAKVHSPAELCKQEVKKKHPIRKNITKYCTQAGDFYRSKKNDFKASWYYVLGGQHDKNINMIQNAQISRSTNLNIGHSYMFKGEYNKAKKFYSIYFKDSRVPWADQLVQSNYKLFYKLYPEEKRKLKQGLSIWNKIYAPLLQVKDLDKNFKKANKEKKYKKAITYLSQIIALQKKYQNQENTSIRDNLYQLGVLYSNDKQYKKSLDALLKVKNSQKKTPYSKKDYSDLLVWIANGYERLYQFKTAIKYREESLKIKVKILGEDHTSLSRSYSNLGILYFKIGSYQKALALYQKAISLANKNESREDLYIAQNYNSIGLVYKYIGNYKESLKYYNKSLQITKKTVGTNHIYVAKGYNNLSQLYMQLGEYANALKFAKKALTIKERILNKKTPSLLNGYSNLGTLYEASGDYEKSLEYYTKALRLKRELLGEDHPDTALSYGQLGMLYNIIGNYRDAVKNTQKALVITKKVMGEESPSTITSYNNLAFVYSDIGNYPKALEYHKKASDISEKVYGKKHIDTAANYNNLGFLYYNMGDFSKALEYHLKALKVKEEVIGEKHLSTALTYNNLGGLYHKLGDYPKALEYYEKALSVREKILGKQHASTAESYNNLGALSKNMNNNTKAMKYLKKALLSQEATLGKEHASTATSYSNLGSLYQVKGNYQKALEYFTKALSIREKVLGEEHPFTALSYNNLSTLYPSVGNWPKSHYFAQKAFKSFLKNKEMVFTILDAQQKEKFLESTSGYILSLLRSTYQYIRQLDQQNNSIKAQQVLRAGANAWLNYKGSVFDSENAIAMLYSSTSDTELKAKIDELISSKRALAKLYQSLPKPKEKNVWIANIKNTEERIAKLTTEISSKANSFKEEQGLASIDYSDIASGLKEGELYIDYAKVGAEFYLFSLDSKEHIEFIKIDKTDAKKIDTLIQTFREDVNVIMDDNTMGDVQLENLTQSTKKKLSELYKLVILKPLGETIKGKTSLIISPDGPLRLLPFEALYDKENNQYLIERKEIRYIPSGKELVRLYRYSKDKKSKAKKSAVIFADPDFDIKVASVDKEQIALTPNTNRSGIIKSLFRMRFDPLPGTAEEAKEIKAILNKDTLLAYQKNKATESNLVKVKEPNILHIATHGFFINDNTIPNPMLKSGIALAGANTSAIKGKSDGIVTALKLSGLDLTGTDLVVLSACQTGVVDINSTDSVSGLSKAFIQAGAKDIVMSLWSVDDQATKELMTSFYQEMKENRNYANALKAAKLKMIEEDRHPFYWAAFVVSGL